MALGSQFWMMTETWPCSFIWVSTLCTCMVPFRVDSTNQRDGGSKSSAVISVVLPICKQYSSSKSYNSISMKTCLTSYSTHICILDLFPTDNVTMEGAIYQHLIGIVFTVDPSHCSGIASETSSSRSFQLFSCLCVPEEDPARSCGVDPAWLRQKTKVQRTSAG